MEIMLPGLVFGAVFLAAMFGLRRSQGTVGQLGRHEIAAAASTGRAVPIARTPILTVPKRASSVGKLAAKLSPEEARSKAATLLDYAGNPMPLGTYLLLRAVFMFALTPIGLV